MALRLAPGYAEEPRHPKLYLIHGGPGAQGTLHGLAHSLPSSLHPREILQSYASEFTDVPRFSPSESREDTLTVARHIDDMNAIILEPSNILGHSWGAMLSLSFASQHPEKCRHLILVGCGTYSPTSRKKYERRIAKRTDIEKKNWLKEAIHNAQSPEERDAAFRAYGDYATAIQSYDPIPDPFPDPNPKYDPDGHAQTWIDAMRLQEEGIEPARFSTIKCPVTLIQGKQDPHPGELIYQDLKPHIPQLNFIELDQCGHEPWLERYARNLFLNKITQICTSA
jgi:pimeloyl-ACP methyl ester carboxylesterase